MLKAFTREVLIPLVIAVYRVVCAFGIAGGLQYWWDR